MNLVLVSSTVPSAKGGGHFPSVWKATPNVFRECPQCVLTPGEGQTADKYVGS